MNPSEIVQELAGASPVRASGSSQSPERKGNGSYMHFPISSVQQQQQEFRDTQIVANAQKRIPKRFLHSKWTGNEQSVAWNCCIREQRGGKGLFRWPATFFSSFSFSSINMFCCFTWSELQRCSCRKTSNGKPNSTNLNEGKTRGFWSILNSSSSHSWCKYRNSVQ